MAEKDKITVEKVKRSGIFDFKDVYQFAYRWLTGEDYDVHEEKYIEEAQPDAKKIEIKWVAEKKISDYFKIELKLEWRIIGMKDVEVEQEGKRIKTNKGTFEVKITGTLIKDYEGTWDGNPTGKFLRGIYEKWIIEGRIRQYEAKVFGEVEDLAEQMKAYLTVEGLK